MGGFFKFMLQKTKLRPSLSVASLGSVVGTRDRVKLNVALSQSNGKSSDRLVFVVFFLYLGFVFF